MTSKKHAPPMLADLHLTVANADYARNHEATPAEEVQRELDAQATARAAASAPAPTTKARAKKSTKATTKRTATARAKKTTTTRTPASPPAEGKE